METAPSYLFHGLTEESEDEIMARDNTHSGVWDNKKLENWNAALLQKWGIEQRGFFDSQTARLSEPEYKSMYYEPEEKPFLELRECLNFDKFLQKKEIVEKSKLPSETKKILLWFVYRFIKIDFQSVADYYYFNASQEEKQVIERLRLVLIDGGEGGFIEDDLLKIINSGK